MPSTALPVVAMDGDAGAMQQFNEGRVPHRHAPFATPRSMVSRCTRSSMHSDLKRVDGPADARPVIELHRLHGNGTFFVNPDLIETIEARPDTTITLVNKHRYVVEDAVESVVERIVSFRARIAAAGTADDNAAGARALNVIETDDQEQAA